MRNVYIPFPFAVVGEVRDAWRIEAPVIPSFIDLEFSDVGPNIAIPGYGRFCYCFERQNRISYTPWVLINVVPLLVPVPGVRNAVDVELLLHPFPGVTLTQTSIRL